MKKIRVTVYLEPGVYANLRAYAASRRQPLSVMAEAAVAAFVDPEQREAVMVRKLGAIERQLDRMKRDANISIEAFMVYVWLWLGANPPLPEQAAVAARASATERYDQFMETLGQRLAAGDLALEQALSEAILTRQSIS
ncbi:CopG family transcriptional regulator [Asticcacaulis sp.]|uniref:CopG family transcriptional regulator n=1 Tax=Asticcacaulis sp. TaxID=1872648 RepID=UPI002BFD0273|nr:CopG family transcriptional regulator [Asticcacaulis sp.]HTM82235.1 CopG family transcriptional regulator [Asticcacaulis sp.]